MGLGISPFLCDYYLLYWELKWCAKVCRNIRSLQLGARTSIPTLLNYARYLDDILIIFPFDIPGPAALKHSNGGPYPDTIGIKSEHRGKRVHFLDVSLSWRRARYNKALSKRHVVGSACDVVGAWCQIPTNNAQETEVAMAFALRRGEGPLRPLSERDVR